jgi:alcohol dehydrogenase
MFKGAFLAGTALSHVKMGLHHVLCHILGGSAGIPHGIANSIILPHAMGFNIDIATPQLAEVAEEMGIARAGRSDEEVAEAGIQAIYKLIGQMHLPQQLRSVGIQETDLPHLAQLALQSSAVKSNPKPIPDAAQIEAVLQAAW